MILGLFFRNYKSYSNLNFIPITNSINNAFSMFIGINGVGKSSILEALNAFFNNGYWNRTKGGKQDATFIAPLFLIEKNGFHNLLSLPSDKIEVYKFISKYFYETEYNSSNAQDIDSFFNFRNILDISLDDYYFFSAGCSYKERNKIFFGGTFDNDLKEKLIENFNFENFDFILDNVRKYYSYIYIPVESRVDDVVKLEASEMQKLMDTNILDEIDRVINEKNIHLKNVKNKTSVINIVNNTLNEFMDNINATIKDIDSDYSFKTDDGYKKNLTASDLRDKILEAYFSIRTLKKDKKEVFELSSGEQRIALIDIATVFIKNQQNRMGNLILAIDEPESSLHISRCFDQFKRLQNLSLISNTQIFITTHWYGSIPILQKGTLNHIEYDFTNKTKINQFSLSNYLESRRDFPDDINLRSYFELVSTIISSIKAGKNKWLIVEGADDLAYFSHYLNTYLSDLIILPVGGAGNVIKMYEFLLAPFMEKVETGILGNAKILCLIDTDKEQKNPRLSYEKAKDNLALRRLQNNEGTVSLVSTGINGSYVETTIEDCLEPQFLYKSIESVFYNIGDSDFPNFYEINTEHCFKGLKKLLKPRNMEAVNNLDVTIEKIRENSFKIQLSEQYCSKHNVSNLEDLPRLFRLVYDFYQK